MCYFELIICKRLTVVLLLTCLLLANTSFAIEDNSSSTVRIVYSKHNPPFNFEDADGNSAGLLPDLWRLWAKKVGYKVEFIAAPKEDTIQLVRDGDADIHSGLMKNEETSKGLLLSTRIYGLSARFYFAANKPPMQNLADIKTKKVGAIKETWPLTYLQKHIPESQIVIFDNSDDMVNTLRQGGVEAIFAADLSMDKLLDHRRLRGLIYCSSAAITREDIFAGILQNRPTLLETINIGFSQISRFELQEIEQRWVKDPSSHFYGATEQTLPLLLSKKEKLWLSKHQQIRIGVNKDWAPINFVDTDETQQGITADYLKLIEKQLQITFQTTSGVLWAEMLEQVKNKKLDVIADIVKTEYRSKFLTFSTSYLNCPYAFVTRRTRNQPIEGLQDLLKKKVVVEKDFYLHSILRNKYPETQLLLQDSTLQALEAVSSERADVYIGNRAVISWLVEQQQLQNLKISGLPNFAPTLLRFGIRKDLPELASMFDKALKTISQAEHRAIHKKWLGGDDLNTKHLFQNIKITRQERAWLNTLGPIRLGVDSEGAPLEYIDNNGTYSGMSSDYIQLFIRQLSLEIAPVEKMTLSQRHNKIHLKELDIIPLIVPTLERSECLNFSKSYLDFPVVIFTRRDNHLITGIDDLIGKRLAVEKDDMTIHYLKRDYPNLEIMEVPTTLAALEAVSFGDAEAFIGNLLTGSYLINSVGLNNIKIAAPSPYRLTFSIGVRKDWPLLIPLLNKSIDSLTEADRADMRHKWLTVRYDKTIDYSLIWKILGGSAVIFILMIWRNHEISQRKAQLEASEKQFKVLINTLPIAIVVVDSSGTIIFDNALASSEIGNNKSLVGRTYQDFYASKSSQDLILTTIAEEGRVVSLQVGYRTNSGELIDCSLSVLPIRFDGQDVLLAVTVNVTERVKMMQALEKAKTHAEEADHLKSAFLASMSHELRTPLNSIIGFTGILLQQLAGPLNDEQNKQLSMVQTSSRHLLALINDILDISKIEAGELEISCETFDMRKSIEKVTQIVEPLAIKQGLTLAVEISPEVHLLNSDQKRVEQILINLLGNAIKFTDTGGVIINCMLENEILIIDVQDTGSGIKQKDMDKLFQTFKQINTGVSRIHEGTGLGLSISKKLVEKLGGAISVQSEWGVGSTFTFTLPCDCSTTLHHQQNDQK